MDTMKVLSSTVCCWLFLLYSLSYIQSIRVLTVICQKICSPIYLADTYIDKRTVDACLILRIYLLAFKWDISIIESDNIAGVLRVFCHYVWYQDITCILYRRDDVWRWTVRLSPGVTSSPTVSVCSSCSTSYHESLSTHNTWGSAVSFGSSATEWWNDWPLHFRSTEKIINFNNHLYK